VAVMGISVPKQRLAGYAGKEIGVSDWLEIDQTRIDLFAETTGDDQFIHVDPVRAKAETPYGGTIAHGFLTLSLVPSMLLPIRIEPEGLKMALNYGLDRVRFMEPVRVGKRIRARAKVVDVTERNPKQVLIKSEITVEIEDNPKPALIAEMLGLYLF
jgi:acyl dehydratase